MNNTDKYTLALKKFFGKKIQKDKHRGREEDAGKKVLEEIKRMKGANEYNMFLYKYKDQVKGLKTLPEKERIIITRAMTARKQYLQPRPIQWLRGQHQLPHRHQAPQPHQQYHQTQ